MRRTREAQSCQPISVCHTAVLPHTNRLQGEHKNYKIDSTDDKKKDPKNPVERKSSRKGPFSTGRIRLCKKWPKVYILQRVTEPADAIECCTKASTCARGRTIQQFRKIIRVLNPMNRSDTMPQRSKQENIYRAHG